jgi:hypothetical protein
MGDLATKNIGEKLHPVAQAQHRQSRVEHIGKQGRGAFSVNGHGSAGEDEAFRSDGEHLFGWRVPGEELAVDMGLAHTAGNELGVLGTEVEDGDGVMHGFLRLRYDYFVRFMVSNLVSIREFIGKVLFLMVAASLQPSKKSYSSILG